MRKPVTWVLVADGQRARVFKSNGRGQNFVQALDHEFVGNRLPSRAIGSDRPGRVNDSDGMGGRHGMEPPTDPHRHEKRRFARELVTALDAERARKSFENLIIVAPPQTLGDIRAELSDALKDMVSAEVGKDLTKFGPHELPVHLEDVI